MNNRYCRWLAGLALYSTWSAAIYYFYALNYLGIFFAVASTAISFILLKSRLDCNFSAEVVDNRPAPVVRDWFVLMLFVAASVTAGIIVWQARTGTALVSPWQVVPWQGAIALVVSTAALAYSLLRQRLPRSAQWAQLSLYYLQLFGVMALVHALGFGFDPFVHEATQARIAELGAVTPKPLYYLGQYGLVVTLHKLAFVPMSFINTWLVPVLAAVLVPPALWLARPATKNHLHTLALCAIPFSFFTLTTPQNLSYLFFVLLIIISTRTHGLLLWIVALATAAIHPLTGIPALCFVALHAIHHRAPRFKKELLAIGTAATALAIPVALAAHNTMQASPAANAPHAPSGLPLPPLFFEGTEHALLNVSYLYGFNIWYLFVIIITIGIYRSWRTGMLNRQLPYILSGAALIASYLITRFIDTSYLISYEQSAFAERLLVIAGIASLPFVLQAIAYFIASVMRQERPVRMIIAAAALTLPLFSLYHSYPRLDNYFNSRSYTTSAADIASVQWIEHNAQGSEYAVLANQQVSAAALHELGFKRYYQTPRGELFFYPIPTGDALYGYYLDMVYTEASRETTQAAAKLMGVDTLYFVVNDYWWAFDLVRAQAEMSADTMQRVEVQGDVNYIFTYTW